MNPQASTISCRRAGGVQCPAITSELRVQQLADRHRTARLEGVGERQQPDPALQRRRRAVDAVVWRQRAPQLHQHPRHRPTRRRRCSTRTISSTCRSATRSRCWPASRSTQTRNQLRTLAVHAADRRHHAALDDREHQGQRPHGLLEPAVRRSSRSRFSAARSTSRAGSSKTTASRSKSARSRRSTPCSPKRRSRNAEQGLLNAEIQLEDGASSRSSGCSPTARTTTSIARRSTRRETPALSIASVDIQARSARATAERTDVLHHAQEPRIGAAEPRSHEEPDQAAARSDRRLQRDRPGRHAASRRRTPSCRAASATRSSRLFGLLELGLQRAAQLHLPSLGMAQATANYARAGARDRTGSRRS